MPNTYNGGFSNGSIPIYGNGGYGYSNPTADGSAAGMGWNQGTGSYGGWGQSTGYSPYGAGPWSGATNTPWGYMSDYQILGGDPSQGNTGFGIPGQSYGIGGGTGGTGGSSGGMTAGMFGAADDGRRDFVHDDYVNAALGRLQSVASGQNLPFDETTRSNMLSRAGDMNAAAEEQQAGSMRDSAAAGGASLSDPSYAAAQRELSSRRQGANANAAQDIDMTANRENFAAQNTANNQMATLRFDQRSRSPVAAQPAPGAGSPNGNTSQHTPLPANGSTTGWNYGGGAGGYANGYTYTPANPMPAGFTSSASERRTSDDTVRNMNNRNERNTAMGQPRFPGDTAYMMQRDGYTTKAPTLRANSPIY